jgi:adenosylcobinamide kinase/adenosylcobinamide-phosphate guanylyltransferase
MLAMETDWERVSMERVDAVEAAITADVNDALDLLAAKHSVIVTNEVGMGLVPAYRMGNLFRDIAGRINQMAAARADEVIFCVSGIPMRIK